MTTRDTTEHVENFRVVRELSSGDEHYRKSRERWEHYTKTKEVAKVPLHVDVELTNVCDLRCPFCETLSMQRPKGLMSEETFQTLVRECDEIGVDSIKLNLWGESLLHKQLLEFIQFAKKYSKLILQFNTNANRMPLKLSRGMVEAGLDRLTVSMDGITKETYEKMRVGGKFEKVMENIEALIAAKKELGGDKPHLTLQIIRTNENLEEIEQFVKHWEPKVDRVSVTNICTTNTPEVLEYSLREDQKIGRKPCDQIWQRLSVLYDGRVTVCCNDYDGFLVIGQLGQDKLVDLWHGEKLTTLRNRHRALDFQGLVCNNCTESQAFAASAEN